MQIAPDTDIILLKTPFEMSDTNQLTFTNATNQYNYFNSLPKLELHNATYQRKDGVVRYPGRFDDVILYNYCMYRNNAFSNKWFYAYIEDVTYNNSNMTDIKLRTDVFQSWEFSINYKQSFVEREHVNDDTIGAHTIPENLEHGEYIVNSIEYDNYNISDPTDSTKRCYIIVSNLNLESTPSSGETYPYSYGGTYAGVFSGNTYYCTSSALGPAQKLLSVQGTGQIESILGLFVAPKWVVGQWGDDDTTGNVRSSLEPKQVNISINKNTSIGSSKFGTYTPKNNKLWIGDYNYLLVNNGAGGTAKYNWEDFTNNQAQFKMIGVLTPGCSIKLVPNNMYFNGNSDVYSLVLGKYPELSFSGDMYLNWLTQTAQNLPLTFGANIVNSGVGIVQGNLNQALSPINQAYNLMLESREHKFDPPMNRGNSNSGDVSYSGGYNRFQFYKMSIKPEYAKIIDDYFSMFGYKVNDVKIPNITGRRNWNYVKTIDINLVGDIPQKDLEELRRIFDNGVTLWHNPSTFLDYSQSNPII